MSPARSRRLAAGLADLGFGRGDRLIVIGDNRPRLYWSMCAAQSLGGVPVPVYQDSVTDELAYVVEHAGARFALAENQEQVDKLLEIQKKVPSLGVVHLRRSARPPALRTGCCPTTRSGAGAKRLAAAPDLVSAEVAKGRGGDDAIMLYTSGTTGRPKGAVLSYDNLVWAAARRRRIRRAQGRRRAALLPADGLGRRPHLLLRPGLRRRPGGELPRIGGHGDDRPARDRADLLLRAAAGAREPDHPGHHPHGGRGLPEARALPLFHGARPQGRPGAARRPAGRPPIDRLLYRAGQPAGLRPAQEHAGHEPRARRLHRGRGGRAGDLQLLPRARRQHEAALRPDRSLRCSSPSIPTAKSIPTRSASRSPRSSSGSPTRRGALPQPRRVQGVFQEPARRPTTPRRPTAGSIPATRATSTTAGTCASSTAPRMSEAERRHAVRAQVHREQAEVLPAHQRGGGLRPRPRLRRARSSTST